jgi:transposase InsO family protein
MSVYNANVLIYQYMPRMPRHGIPLEWVTDTGAPYNALFLATLSKLVDIKHRFTPAFHPQSNGLVENFAKTLRHLILSFTSEATRSRTWDKQLQHLRFAYNTSFHPYPSIQDTPFLLALGRDAPFSNLN